MKSNASKLVGAIFAAALAATPVWAIRPAPRCVIADGGGTSSNGLYSISGTIGQAEAGASMSGGAFSVSGGFWPGVTTDELPALSIRLAVGNTVIINWPNTSTGYVLQRSSDLSAPGGGWTDMTQSPVAVGSSMEVTLPATGQASLFRLRGL